MAQEANPFDEVEAAPAAGASPPAEEEANPFDEVEEAPAAEANPFDEAPEAPLEPQPDAAQLEEEREAALDENVREVHRLVREIPADDYALAERIADRTGLEPRAAWKQLRQLRQDMAVADLKPREWRKAHPYLDALVQENPRKGALFIADEKMSAVTEKFRQAGVLGASVLRTFGDVLKRPEEYLGGTAELPLPKPEEYDVTKQVLQEKSPLAQTEGFARFQIVSDAFNRARGGEEVQRKYYEAYLAGEAGNEAEETRLLQEASGMQRKLVAQDYGQGPWESIVLDGVNVAGSVAGSFQAAGKGALVGGGGGAAVGALFGPAGAALGAKLGAEAGAGFGVFAHSSEVETGGGFQSFLEARTDDGKLVSRATARHAATVHGIVAPVVETVAFQQVLKAMGVPSGALAGGTLKPALMEALKKPAFHRFLKSAVEGAASEAGEEGVQELSRQVVGYLFRSKEAGALQTPDVRGAAVEVGGAVGEAFSGSLLLGLGTGTVNVTSTAVAQRFMEDRQQKSDATTQTLVEAAATPSAQAAPDVAAQLLQREFAAQGQTATHVQVSAQALVRLFQTAANPQEAATAMLGEDAQESLQMALATDERLEVPNAKILALGAKAATLLEDMADSPATLTRRQATAHSAALDAQARALAEQHGPSQETTQIEKRLDALEDQLTATGKYTAAQSREKVENLRAFVRTQTANFKLASMDELFGNLRVSVENDPNGNPVPVLRPAVEARLAKTAEATAEGQPASEEQLGVVEVRGDEQGRDFRVLLKPNANMSTFLHETSHAFLWLLGDLAARRDAPQQVKDDYAEMLKALGAASREEITVAQHEVLARSGEVYFREGRIVSDAMRRPMQRYKTWLQKVYPSLQGNMRIHLSEEVKGVFDRMIATEEEIARARGTSGFRALFLSAEEARMSPEDFAALRASYSAADEKAVRAVEARARQAEAEAATEARQEEEAKASEEVGREYDARPDVRAARYLRDGVWLAQGEDGQLQEVQLGGPVGLERKAVLRMLGAKEVPAALRALVRTKQDSAARTAVHPDEVAELFGYETGVALLAALKAVPRREAFVEEEVARRMAEAHPTVLTDSTQLRQTVQDALHEEGTTEPLLREWAALRRMLPEGSPLALPLEAVRRAARLMAQRTRVRRADAQNARLAEKRASLEAADAWAAGDIARANAAKTRQVLNHLLYRELAKLRPEVSAFNALLNAATSKKTRQVLGKGGLHFRDAVDALVEAFSTEAVAAADTLEGKEAASARSKALTALLEAMKADKLPTNVFDEDSVRRLLLEPRSWQDMTLSQMREAAKFLQTAQHLAEDATRVRLKGKKQSLEAMANDMRDDIAGQRMAIKIADDKVLRPLWQRLLYMATGAAQSWREPEEQLRHLGPTAYNFFVGGLLETRKEKAKLAREVGEFFVTKWRQLPEALQARRYEVVDTSALPQPARLGREGPFTRQWVWMVALNFGNEATRRHLLQGYEWTEKQVEDFLAATLEKEELDFLQGVWDLMDEKLEPRLAAHYEALNGVRPDASVAAPIRTPHGTYRGGFFPMRDDTDALAKAHAKELTEALRDADDDAAEAGLRSFTPPRKGEVRVPNLSWEVVPAHVGQTIHYLATDAFVRDARRVLENPTAAQAIVQRRGQVGFEMLESFVDVVETDQPDTTPSRMARYVMAPLNWMKGALTKAALAFNLANVAADFLGPFVGVVIGKVPPLWLGRVYPRALGGLLPPVGPLGDARAAVWTDMRKRVLKKSWFMRERHTSSTDTLRKALEEVGAAGNTSQAGQLLRAADEGLFVLQGVSDSVTSTVTWEARYQQAIAQGLDEEAAVKAGDDAVRGTFPSSDIALQPYALRDKTVTGGLIAMFSYMAKVGNIKVSLVQGPLERLMVSEGWGDMFKRTGLLALAGAQVLLVSLLAKSIPDAMANRGPDDDEEWEDWIIRSLATADAENVPFIGWALGPAAEAVINAATGKKQKRRPVSARAAPAMASVERIAKALGTATDSDKEWDERGMALVGMLNAQAGKTGRYVLKAAEGEAPTEPWDIFKGVLYGPPREK